MWDMFARAGALFIPFTFCSSGSWRNVLKLVDAPRRGGMFWMARWSARRWDLPEVGIKGWLHWKERGARWLFSNEWCIGRMQCPAGQEEVLERMGRRYRMQSSAWTSGHRSQHGRHWRASIEGERHYTSDPSSIRATRL